MAVWQAEGINSQTSESVQMEGGMTTPFKQESQNQYQKQQQSIYKLNIVTNNIELL